jgi:hypothetical protein
MAMTDTERVINFCVDYFNKHDADDDEQITASDVYIMSYTDIGIGWSAMVYMPNGYIYELRTVDIYDTVVLSKYKKCGDSMYKWEDA